ncbi:MAG: pantetheine-phosphate adenylyltransferase [Muribaculaceae bacterium]|nr:pantetheine-phosphate adenylyltransferase [Muribaculaceae bacterium]
MLKRVALYPGTFDPFTVGHLSIVERGLQLFDEIVIAIGINESKKNNTSIQQRIEHIERVTTKMPGVRVVSYNNLTVEAAKEHGANFILRGVRTVADYEYERNLAYANRNLTGIETVLLYTLPELSYISSTMVRDLQRHGYDVSPYVPDEQ